MTKTPEERTHNSLPHSDAVPKSAASGSLSQNSFWVLGSGALMVSLWIGMGSFFAGYDWWVPVPLVGYFRHDIALALVLVQASVLVTLAKQQDFHPLYSRTMILLLLLGVFALPQLSTVLPKVYLHQPPQSVREKMIAQKSGPVVQHSNIISNQSEIERMIQLIQAPETRAHWTHVSVALGLPYFTLGNNAHFDHVLAPHEQATHVSTYSLEFGYKPSEQKQARQSLLRLNFPEVIKETHTYLADQGYPAMVRPLLARVLKVADPQQIVLSTDLHDDAQAYRLGLPGVVVMYPNIIWDYFVNPHHDGAYKKHGLKRLAHHPCPNQRTTEARTILIPLSTPQGSGLTYWTPEEQQIMYSDHPGDAWTFRSKLLHSIRHWPYREWARGTPRMTLQAFAVQCEDATGENDKWYVYH